MKRYRIVADNFLGFEAQMKFIFFPFRWFQMQDFFWINTFPTIEHAHHFIEQSKAGIRKPTVSNHLIESHHEYEREVKLLLPKVNKAKRIVVWADLDSNTSNRSFFPRMFPANA